MINTDYKLIWADSYITLKLQYIFLCVCSGNHSLPYYFSSSDKNIRLLEILERTSELISKSHLSLGFTGWWKWKNSSALSGALMCRSPSFLPRALILGKAQDWAVTYWQQTYWPICIFQGEGYKKPYLGPDSSCVLQFSFANHGDGSFILTSPPHLPELVLKGHHSILWLLLHIKLL